MFRQFMRAMDFGALGVASKAIMRGSPRYGARRFGAWALGASGARASTAMMYSRNYALGATRFGVVGGGMYGANRARRRFF